MQHGMNSKGAVLLLNIFGGAPQKFDDLVALVSRWRLVRAGTGPWTGFGVDLALFESILSSNISPDM